MCIRRLLLSICMLCMQYSRRVCTYLVFIYRKVHVLYDSRRDHSGYMPKLVGSRIVAALIQHSYNKSYSLGRIYPGMTQLQHIENVEPEFTLCSINLFYYLTM